MIASMILLVSIAALAQFFLSYIRALLRASTQEAISPIVLEACSLEGIDVTGADFHHLMLRAQLCSNREGAESAALAVRVYFRMVSLLRQAFGPLIPVLRQWAAQEQAACARFALAALNHRAMIDSSASH